MKSGKNLQYDFLKMRGGVKGRLELFRKFIRFGGHKRPLGRPLTKKRGALDQVEIDFPNEVPVPRTP